MTAYDRCVCVVVGTPPPVARCRGVEAKISRALQRGAPRPRSFRDELKESAIESPPFRPYSSAMTPKSATATLNGDDAKYLAAIDECIAEIAAIRRDIKKQQAETQRLKESTRRKLDALRSNVHAGKAS